MSDMYAFIVVGDTTDHGGIVLEGSPADTIDGKPIARVGDKVYCKKCRRDTYITEGNPQVLIDGRMAAFHTALTSCGARLIAKQNTNFIGGSEDGGAQGIGVSDEEEHITLQDPHDEQASLPESAAPGLPYYIETADGRVFSGRVESDGKLPRIETDGEDAYTVLWGDDALLKIEEGAA